jgi:hypothetical protein
MHYGVAAALDELLKGLEGFFFPVGAHVVLNVISTRTDDKAKA